MSQENVKGCVDPTLLTNIRSEDLEGITDYCPDALQGNESEHNGSFDELHDVQMCVGRELGLSCVCI